MTDGKRIAAIVTEYFEGSHADVTSSRRAIRDWSSRSLTSRSLFPLAKPHLQLNLNFCQARSRNRALTNATGLHLTCTQF